MRNLIRASAVLGAALSVVAVNSVVADDSVIRIGVMTDLSGQDSDVSGQGSIAAVQMAVEDAGGMVAGRKVEVVFADQQRKADISAAIAAQWYDKEGVDVIIDVALSSAGLAVQEVARQRNKVVIFTTAATSDLTGKACSPTGFHWAYDTSAVANGTAAAVAKEGGKNWFFVTSDYAFGHALERDAIKVLKDNGGAVVGDVRHPVATSDLSSFLLKAQASKAQVIGLANSAADFTSSVRQAKEFGIVEGGQKLAGLLAFITDIHSLGLEAAQGMQLTESFYWDLNDETRAWSKRFAERRGGRKPTMIQAANYSAIHHYLKAITAANSADGPTVAAKMRAIPVNDFMTKDATIWRSGWVHRDFYLFQVKSPKESKGEWDYYKLVSRIPADQAKPKGSDDACPLMTQ